MLTPQATLLSLKVLHYSGWSPILFSYGLLSFLISDQHKGRLTPREGGAWIKCHVLRTPLVRIIMRNIGIFHTPLDSTMLLCANCFFFFLRGIMGLRQQNFCFIDDATEVGGCDVPSVLQLEAFLGF